MKRKIFSALFALVLLLSLSLVTAVPAAAADEGTNYSPFGEMWYIWGADQEGQANVIKWFYLGGDGSAWDGHKITVVNSQWPEFNGQAYLKNTGTPERFTLWRDANFTDQVTTEEIGSIGGMDVHAAQAIDGWVEFDPAIDSIGDPRETVGNMSHMFYDRLDAGSTGGNLEVKLGGVENAFYDGWYLELVECGWTDLNGGWYLKWVAQAGAADWYELYADAGFTQPGIPAEPGMFEPMGGAYGNLEAPRGRLVLPDYLLGAPVKAAGSAYAAGGSTGGTQTPNASIIADAAAGESASVILAEYGDTPIEDESVFNAVGEYIDVHCDDAENLLDEVIIRVNYDGADMTDAEELGLRMSYWNSDVGDWRQCSDQSVNIADDYIQATITALTTPDLSYLAGGPFGGGPASVELDSEWYKTGDPVKVTIEDATESGVIAAFAWSDTVHEAGKITFALPETETGIFEGSFDLVDTTPDAGELLVNDGDNITVAYLAVGYNATVDDTPPEITNLTPADSSNTTKNKPTISATYTDVGGSGVDNATAEMKVDGSAVAFTATTSSITYTPSDNLTEGRHDVTVDVKDVAGNQAEQASWSFTVDTGAPTITDLTPVDGDYTNDNTPTISAVLDDITSGIDAGTIVMTVDEVDISENATFTVATKVLTYTPTDNLTDGEIAVTINVSDLTGNAAEEASWAFTVDTDDLAIAIGAVTSPTSVATQAVSGNFTETNLDAITLTVNDVPVAVTANVSEGTWETDEAIALTEGDNVIVATITDLAGNETSDEDTIVLDTVAPEVTDAEANPDVIQTAIPTDVTFSANVTDDGGTGVVSVSANLTAIGGAEDQAMNDTGDGIYEYTWTALTVAEADTYELTITATDDMGNTNDTVHITLQAFTDADDPLITDPGVFYLLGYESARPNEPVVIYAVVTDITTEVASVTVDATAIGLNDSEPMDPVDLDGYYMVELTVGAEVTLGTHTLTITATDIAGNNATEDVPVEVVAMLTAYNIWLYDGWNLVSLPLIPTDDSIEVALAGLSTVPGGTIPDIVSVWGYDPDDGWLSYFPGVTSDLTHMTDGCGYWIDVEYAVGAYPAFPAFLTIHGTEQPLPGDLPPEYDVVIGWNLIGYKFSYWERADVYLAGITDSVVRIYGFDNGIYYVVQLDENMIPGFGYWLAVTESGTIYP